MSQEVDIFLSYNRQEKEVVLWIAKALRDRGIQVWLDVWDLVPGSLWTPAVDEALQKSKSVAVLVGKDGLGPWEQYEYLAALSESVSRGLPVIPVLLPGAPAEVKLPLFLKSFTWVDLRGDLKEGLDDLERGISGRNLDNHEDPGPNGSRLHNLPFPSLGELFKGRSTELKRIETQRGTGKCAQVICGLGGIGKTRLAIEYAWRVGDRYTATWFVRADSREALRHNLAALAGPALLNLPGRTAQAEEEVIGAVLRWLRENPGWLLILDGVDSEEASRAVGEILPFASSGRMLVTSRLRDWPPQILGPTLDIIGRAEAVEYLLDRTEGGRVPAADDSDQSARLATALDGLPIALEQAAAYIVRHHLRFADYLQSWEIEREQVLRWNDERISQYPTAVAVTWQKTFLQLRPTAAALLRLTAFLAPDPIPVRIFEIGASHVRDSTRLLCKEMKYKLSHQNIAEALAELEAYSMIVRQDQTFTVHCVVQEVLRHQISRRRRRSWLEKSLRIVFDASTDPQDVQNWPSWDSLRSHAARVVDEADEEGITTPTAALMQRLGLLLLGKSLHAEAERLMRRALKVDETVFGADHHNLVAHLRNLAQLLIATGRLPDAERLIRHALKIGEDAFGPNHPSLVTTLNSLAWLLKDTEKFSEAERLMKRACAIDEAAFGSSHQLATDLHNLAWLMKDTNRLPEAEELIRRASKIDEATLGKHPNLARDLNGLAWLLKDTGRPSDAELLMRRALEIDESAFGLYHVNISRDLRSLVWLLRDRNRLSEAKPLMRRALEIDKAVFGPDHPHIARDLTSLARLLKDADQRSEAESLMRKAFDILKASLGAGHPTTRIMRKDLDAFIS